MIDAAHRGDTTALHALLLAPAPANLHAYNDAALHATIIGNQPAAAKMLIDAGAAVRAIRFRGDPLEHAALRGRTKIALMLLEAGADPHDNNGAAREAARSNKRHPEILEAIEEAERQRIHGVKVKFRDAAVSVPVADNQPNQSDGSPWAFFFSRKKPL